MNIREIGLTIRKRRISLKVSQKSLGEISGISVHALSDIESGRGNPTIKSLNRILKALGFELRLGVVGDKRRNMP